MPSSVVHGGLALLVAVGLLGAYYDRRALAVVLAILVIPESDTLLGWVVDGAHRTVLHNAVLPAVLAVGLYWETTREASRLRQRLGDAGVRLAWVGLFVHAFAHLALDWAHLQGINVFWPLHDQFFRLKGEVYLSTTEGFVQTFVEVAADPETGRRRVDAGGGGGRAETHVPNPAQPSDGPEPGAVDRRFPVAVQGWQLYLVLTGLFAVAAKRLQTGCGPDGRGPDGRDRREGDA